MLNQSNTGAASVVEVIVCDAGTTRGEATVLDRPIIAVAPVGDALVKDVLLELRLALASAFDAEIIAVPGWFSNTLAETDRKGVALCADHVSQLARVRSHA